MLRIFSSFKNPTASAGFEPANLGTKGQHATPRPPKPLITDLKEGKNCNLQLAWEINFSIHFTLPDTCITFNSLHLQAIIGHFRTLTVYHGFFNRCTVHIEYSLIITPTNALVYHLFS